MRATRDAAVTLAVGFVLAVAGRGTAADPKPLAILKADGVAPVRVAYAPDGKTVVVVGGMKGGYAVRAFDATTGQVSASLDLPVDGAAPLPAIRPDGRAVAVIADDRQTVYVQGLSTGEKRVTLDGPMSLASSVAFSPDGATVAVADFGPSKSRVRLLDAATGKERAGLTVRPRLDITVFSPDGKALAFGQGVWDLATGKRLVELGGRLGDALAVGLAFSPDGKRVAAAVPGGDQPGARYVVRVWDTGTGAETATVRVGLDRVRAVAFSPDGKGLAVAGPAQKAELAELWDVASGKRRAAWDSEGMAFAVAFRPDGKVLAVARSNAVLLWPVPEPPAR